MKIRFGHKGDLLQHLDSHFGDSAIVHAELPRCAYGEIDDAAANVGATVIDADDNGFVGLEIDDTNLGAERKFFMGTCEGRATESFPTGCAMVSVPRGNPCFHVDGVTFVNRGFFYGLRGGRGAGRYKQNQEQRQESGGRRH